MTDDFTDMFKNAAPIGGGYSKSSPDEAAKFIEGIAKDKAQNEASAKKHGTNTRRAFFETSSGCVCGWVEWEEDFATFRGQEISMGMAPRFVPDEAGQIIIDQMYDTFPGAPWSVSGDLQWVNIPLEDGHYGSPEYKLDYSDMSHVTDAFSALPGCSSLTSAPDPMSGNVLRAEDDPIIMARLFYRAD